MTILVVALLGVGAVLIASGLDNTPIVTTFQKIISGQPIDWSGGTSTDVTKQFPDTTTKPTNGTCPSGYVLTKDPNGGPDYCTKISSIQQSGI